MTDITQNTLLLVIVALSLLLLILGIQVFFILNDLRKTLVKANKMLDKVNAIAENVVNSASAFSVLGTVVKTGAHLVSLIKGNGQSQVKNDKKRRFFRGIIKKEKPEAFL